MNPRTISIMSSFKLELGVLILVIILLQNSMVVLCLVIAHLYPLEYLQPTLLPMFGIAYYSLPVLARELLLCQSLYTHPVFSSFRKTIRQQKEEPLQNDSNARLLTKERSGQKSGLSMIVVLESPDSL